MNFKYCLFHPSLISAAGFSLIMLQAVVPTHAQTANPTDASGINVFGSETAKPPEGVENAEAFTPESQAAVNQEARQVNTLLSTTSLTTTDGRSIPSFVQQSLLSVLTNTGNVDASEKQLCEALANAPGGKNLVKPQGNCTLVRGLTEGNKVEATKLRASIEAFNATINASGVEFLSGPPIELLAIRAALSRLVNAAIPA